jgi:hypothetical protein
MTLGPRHEDDAGTAQPRATEAGRLLRPLVDLFTRVCAPLPPA